MSYIRHQTKNSRLQSYIEYYNSFKGNKQNEKQFISLPEGKIGLVFMIKGTSEGVNSKIKTHRCESHISGLIQEPTFYKLSSNVETFSVVFKPGALFNFIPKFPIDELAKSSVSLFQIFGNQLYQIEDRIAETACNLNRIAIIEQFLLSNMQDEDLRISAAVKMIDSNISSITVNDLSKYLNIGNRQLRNIFNEKLGLSPKQFIRMFRFKTALGKLPELYQKNSHYASSLGYYDESHFIHEFKSFAGMTPSQYFKNQTFISDFSNFNRLMMR